MTTTLPDMECSWFPELWIHECCVAHDIGVGDLAFMDCIVSKSDFLGPFAFLFAGIVVGGMALFRPVYEKYKKWKSSIARRKDG